MILQKLLNKSKKDTLEINFIHFSDQTMPTEEKQGKLSKFKLFGRKNKKQTPEIVVTDGEAAQKPNTSSAPSPAFINRRSRIFNPFKSVRKAVIGNRQKGKKQEECKKNTTQEITDAQQEDSKIVLSEKDIQNLDVIQNEVVIVEDMRKNRPRGPPGRKRRPTRSTNAHSATSPKITGNAIDNRPEEEKLDKQIENGIHEPPTSPVSEPPTSPGNESVRTSSVSKRSPAIVLSTDSVDNLDVDPDVNCADNSASNRQTENKEDNTNSSITKDRSDVVVEPDFCKMALSSVQKEGNNSNSANLSQLG